MRITNLRALVGGRAVSACRRSCCCHFGSRNDSARIFERVRQSCFGLEHDRKRLPWLCPRRALRAYGGVWRLATLSPGCRRAPSRKPLHGLRSVQNEGPEPSAALVFHTDLCDTSEFFMESWTGFTGGERTASTQRRQQGEF